MYLRHVFKVGPAAGVNGHAPRKKISRSPGIQRKYLHNIQRISKIVNNKIIRQSQRIVWLQTSVFVI